MALREIVQIGEPVLRKKAKPVEVIDEKREENYYFKERY